ncbi:IS3 family transposase [Brachybacterium fresconis]
MVVVMSKRKRYTPEYRREAAALVLDTDRPIAHVAEEIDVGAQLLGRWVQQERERRGPAPGPEVPLAADEREELKRLRRRVHELETDNEFLGKAAGLLRVEATTAERFELMDAEKANFEITRMARLLGVTRQGYYAWQRRRQHGPGSRAQRRTVIDRKTVAASMRRQGLEGISPSMFTPVTTIQDPAARGFADHAQRRWDQGRLDAIWISDITYLRTGEGWLYLAAVRDGHSRRVLGWAMDECQDAGLVDRALRMARTLRRDVPDDLVFHADRGTQYTSKTLFETCEELGIRQSMGRTGVCWDNAMAESFWATLKTEFYDRRSWPTRAEARREVARWIEIVFNRRRLHSSLDYTSPVAFENAIDRDQAETEEHTDQAQAA